MNKNFWLILLLIIIIFLSGVMNLCVNKYYSYIFPDKVDIISERVEPSWDKTLAERVVKIFIPKWQEDILDQERIIRISDDAKKVITACLKITDIYEKNKKYDKAIETCSKILKNYPEHLLRKKAYLKLASIYEKDKNFAKAREMNELIIQEFPDDFEAVKAELSAITSYEKEGKYQKAIDGYLNFLDKYPKTKERDYLSFKIGLLYKKLGQINKAKEFYQGITWDRDNVWEENARAELWLATGKEKTKKKVIYAIKVSIPPKIDGYLTDPVWEKGDKVTDFKESHKNIPVTQKTFAALVYDEKNLYVAFKCLEIDISGLVAKSTEHDSGVWGDDCIEVFLDTNRDYSTYFQFIVNPIGTKVDGENKNKTIWNPKWKVATAIGERHWNIEIAIPFKELKTSVPKAGEIWGLNLTRARRAGGKEISAWSFTEGNHHTPQRFGYVIFK